jgi:glycosyltransferase involved in cell wall biosynthesis
MRIALVALSCQPGGMRHYASQLANALAEEAEVHVFTPDLAGLAPYLSPRVAGHALRRLSAGGQRARNLLRQLNLASHAWNARAIRALAPDAVHLVTEHPCNPLMVALLDDLPICFTHHDPSGHLGEGAGWRRALAQLTARRADRVVVHAEALRAELAAQGLDPARVAVVPHGDYGFLGALAPELPEEPMILSFGRIVAYKGLDVLCRAERLLAGRLDPYEVCIAGEGDPGVFAAEIGPSGRVRVLNRFLDDAEVAALFRRARLVVLPYRQASQSGVAAIALALGKPLIVSDAGGLPEAVGHGEAGVIVPAGDAEALAGAIARLWDDPAERARLAEAGRDHARRASGWPAIARRHLAIYRESGAGSGALAPRPAG